MKKVLLTALFCACASGFAAAETPDIITSDGAAACQALVRYQAAEDVEYKPGVDVRGNPVVEADINPSNIKPPETIRATISIDLAQFVGIDLPEGTEMQANMGTVEIKPDGSMTFNGKPAGGDAEAVLYALCEEGEKKPEKQQKPSLQKQPDINYTQ